MQILIIEVYENFDKSLKLIKAIPICRIINY